MRRELVSSDGRFETTPDELTRAVETTVQPFLTAVSHLLLALADWHGPIPQPVMDAADEIRVAVAALTGHDIGPPPS